MPLCPVQYTATTFQSHVNIMVQSIIAQCLVGQSFSQSKVQHDELRVYLGGSPSKHTVNKDSGTLFVATTASVATPRVHTLAIHTDFHSLQARTQHDMIAIVQGISIFLVKNPHEIRKLRLTVHILSPILFLKRTLRISPCRKKMTEEDAEMVFVDAEALKGTCSFSYEFQLSELLKCMLFSRNALQIFLSRFLLSSLPTTKKFISKSTRKVLCHNMIIR